MNRQNYRAAFDAVDFSPDFEARMATLLRRQRTSRSGLFKSWQPCGTHLKRSRTRCP